MLGDSTAALQVAISLKSAKSLNTISREIAWRRVRHAWHYAVGHLPAELNVAADALSRVFANNVAEKKVRPRLCEGASTRWRPTLPRLVDNVSIKCSMENA